MFSQCFSWGPRLGTRFQVNYRCCIERHWLARGEGRLFLFRFSVFLFVCPLLMISIN